jgi:lipopolysaccharide/colanic/teichoic acid biosynthesis glycosyltransferase
MLKRETVLWRRTFILADIAVVVLAYFISYKIRTLPFFDQLESLKPMAGFEQYLQALWLVVIVYAFSFYFFGFYKEYLPRALLGLIWAVMRGCIAGTLLLAAALFVFKVEFFSRAFFVQITVLITVFILCERLLALALFQWLRRGTLRTRYVLIVGTADRVEEVARLFELHSRWGFEVVGTLLLSEDYSDQPRSRRVLGSVNDLEAVVRDKAVDDIVFALPKNRLIDIEQYIWICEQMGVAAHIMANFFNVALSRTYLQSIHGVPVLTYSPAPRSLTAAFIKRGLDLGLAGLLMILGGLPFVFTLVSLKIVGKKPVMLKKEVVGYFGRTFNIYALNATNNGIINRVTRLFAIDKLPILTNIVKGDMSFVGPLPATPDQVKQYDTWQRRRHSIKPGLIGMLRHGHTGEVNGDEGVRLDLAYIDNWSVWLDLKLIVSRLYNALVKKAPDNGA